MPDSISFVLLIVAVALVFDFINGFHDSANSIATVVSTRVLSPGVAVAWAAFFNFIAAFTVGTAVAKTISKGLVDPAIVDPTVVLAALLGAIVWNLVTWYVGLPSSSSHALLGGFAGAAIAKAGIGALILSGWVKPILGIVISPVSGRGARPRAHGRVLLAALQAHRPPARQALSPPAARIRRPLFAEPRCQRRAEDDGHHRRPAGVGAAPVQGCDRLAAAPVPANADHVPLWVELAAYSAIAMGTAMGGWRIVKTMGSKITKLTPFSGFCAETGGGVTILLASVLGVPVSTTHTITGAIVGVGAARRVGAVRWGVAGRIVWAWILTIPLSAAVAAMVYLLLQLR